MTTAWTDDLVATFTKLFNEGVPHSAIAAKLGITTSASIGKARRLGFQHRPVGASSAQAARLARALRTPGKRHKPTRPVVVCVDPAAGVSLDELDAPGAQRMCRYIAGPVCGPATRYCGAETVALGKPYCPEHHALCWSNL